MKELTVIDFFCGAGGFSEGFRQQGFKILMGIDNWEPAIKTFNHNFKLECKSKSVLDFENSIDEIEALPDTDVIIGSPPCVTFSTSNKSGKADKSLGVRLTEVFLRIVAVKKHKPNSTLKAWFMENVTNSVNYLNDYYTFKDLNLSNWARKHNISPSKIAIILKDNQPEINSSNYGSPQSRIRVISGEIVKHGKLVIPPNTHQPAEAKGNLQKYITLRDIRNSLPSPNSKKSDSLTTDPLYPSIRIKISELSDHFYDTGLYECEWKQSMFLKTNHPYMGRMSFPENENKPSRTITATKIGSSREAIVYLSEYKRKGNGEYRTPTIRESATLMGFPITYQFVGSETAKCRLVGNAVCPSVSKAFAKLVRKELGLNTIKKDLVQTTPDLTGVNNLNTFSPKVFEKPPKRNKGSRFRRHPFKDGNLTITLSNYDITKNERKGSKWITSIQYGNGEGFPVHNYPNGFYKKLEPIIAAYKNGKKFLHTINNGFSEKIGNKWELQEMYENQKSNGKLLEPSKLIEEVARIINNLKIDNEEYIQKESNVFKEKHVVPLKQLYALYAINKISSNT
ncbi:MAG: DNA cytosine methyltransferase [Chitinophagales bacterium]|nr:DNA cytosine methyltransferase [Chitinophagales bacterium]